MEESEKCGAPWGVIFTSALMVALVAVQIALAWIWP